MSKVTDERDATLAQLHDNYTADCFHWRRVCGWAREIEVALDQEVESLYSTDEPESYDRARMTFVGSDVSCTIEDMGVTVDFKCAVRAGFFTTPVLITSIPEAIAELRRCFNLEASHVA